MKDEKKKYTAPELTVVTFKVERGYAASAIFDGVGLGSSNAGSGGQEEWEEDTYEGTGWY